MYHAVKIQYKLYCLKFVFKIIIISSSITVCAGICMQLCQDICVDVRGHFYGINSHLLPFLGSQGLYKIELSSSGSHSKCILSAEGPLWSHFLSL